MNRYKVKQADFEKVKKYLKGKLFKNKTPSWGIKFKERLTVKKGKILFDGLQIVPQEEADSFLCCMTETRLRSAATRPSTTSKNRL